MHWGRPRRTGAYLLPTAEPAAAPGGEKEGHRASRRNGGGAVTGLGEGGLETHAGLTLSARFHPPPAEGEGPPLPILQMEKLSLRVGTDPPGACGKVSDTPLGAARALVFEVRLSGPPVQDKEEGCLSSGSTGVPEDRVPPRPGQAGFPEALVELPSRQKPQCVLPSAASGDDQGLAETRIVAAAACG